MKTIKERAEEYMSGNFKGPLGSYIQGATDQKMIDTAIAANEFNSFLDSLVRVMPSLKETVERQRTTWTSTFKERLTSE